MLVSMEEVTRAIIWEAPEHHHYERGNDWYWALWIIAIGAAVAAFFLSNFLLALLIIIAAAAMTLMASREPSIMEFAVTSRGVKLGDRLYPYGSLHSFTIDEAIPEEPQLLLKSSKTYLPLLVIPIPLEYIDDIDDLLSSKLEEEDLEEPFGHKLLEFLGF